MNQWLKHLYSAAFERPRGFAASCETFFASRQLAVGNWRRHIAFNFSSTSFHKPPSVHSFAIQVKNCRPIQLCEKVIAKTYTRIEVNFNKRGSVTICLETPTGASDPPLYLCKKLERSLKSNEAEPTIFLVLTQILIEAVPPFHTHTRAYLFRYQSSPKKFVKSLQKVQKVRALRRAPGPGSVNADPGPESVSSQ